MKRTPTKQSYGELEEAYRHFNRTLFKGKLPPCLITLNRKRSAKGYFWSQKFERHDGKRVTDEIALNPDLFRRRTDAETLSTLVHEMVHLWQYHFGKPGRGRYHNKEWADKMDSLGLIASSTGKPGGKRTGDRVTHYIKKNGRYATACEELLETGFKVTWHSRSNSNSTGKSGQRVKYICGCGNQVWGKDGLDLACMVCEEPLKPVLSH